MHDFKYRGSQLYCENVKIEELALRFGTPLYVYSRKTLLAHYLKLKRAFRSIKPLICFSVKANSNLAILKTLVNQGAGLDVVSGGELFRALRAGCPARRIVYASVGKTAQEIRQAIDAGILFFNVESLPELGNINRIAKSLHKRARAAIRINPDVAPKTHKFITTGKLTNKFGVDLKTAYAILRRRADFSYVDISGLHIHIGSQITEGLPFIQAISRVVKFLNQLKRRGISLQYFNIGGGLGIIYDKETPQSALDFASRAVPLLRKTGLKIILEPGRFIAGNAGILVVRVLYMKDTAKKKFVIVDGAMNDLIRPALYDAYHEILPLRRRRQAGNRIKYDVVGPICESSDFFAKGRRLPAIREGNYLAIMGAGAYGFSMSSNYNSRLRAAEVMVAKDKTYLVRKRDSYTDLIANELIPKL
ncbi:diaminopimelate decarboxylase [Candidatus Omnitrophota bacterium]